MSKIAPSAFGIAIKGNNPSLQEVIEAIKERTTWPFMRDVLKKNGIAPGNGWALLMANAEGTMVSGETIDQFVRRFHAEIVVSGERYTKVYELNEDNTNSLVVDLEVAAAQDSVFSSKYPLPLVNQLLKSMDEAPILVDVRRYANGDRCLVYCSSRSYEHREKYEYAQLGKEVQSVYKGIHQLITVERRYFQAYDVLYFRKKLQRIEICIDQPGRGGIRVAENAINTLLTLLAAQNVTLQTVFQRQPMNLFKAIRGIYETSGEGIIKNLSFRTLTGSTKTEVMQSDSDDLRSELFHSAGAQAVGNKIRPYEIAVEFQFPGTKDTASVVLAASIRELSADPGNLSHCIVNTDNGNTISLAINKLVKYIC